MTRQMKFACMTLAAGFLLVAHHAARAQTAPLDHYDCYYPGPQPVQSVNVQLQDVDMFSPGAVGPVEPISNVALSQLCNPVRKTLNGVTTPISNPLDHLAMYAFSPPPAPAPSPRILISNQFTSLQLLQLFSPVLLAVPTGKAEAGPTAGPPPVPPIPTDLDHFQCYLAEGAAIGARVVLQDQFDFVVTPFGNFPIPRTVQVRTPRLFCDAAQKSVCSAATGSCVPGTVPVADAHLACYVISPLTPPFTAPKTVSINNQFVTPPLLLTLTEGTAHLLCVPSTVVAVVGAGG